MMLFLTGATSSVTKSEESVQNDVNKSLGGFISSSPVPNGAVNALFDLVSMKTIKDRIKETIAVGLVNKFDAPVGNVSVKMVCKKNDACCFKVAAVALNEELCMEHIPNRYSEPLNAEFHDVDFYRAGVDVEILRPGIIGEEISFEPFGVVAEITEGGIEGTYKSVAKAFSSTAQYEVTRLSETTFRIERNDETVVESEECSYLSSDVAEFRFNGKYENEKNNEAVIIERLEPNSGIGIWIQRTVSDNVEKTDEQLIRDYDDKVKIDKLEEIDLVINYNNIEINE